MSRPYSLSMRRMRNSKVHWSRIYWTERAASAAGHEELQRFFEILATRKPKMRQFYRTGYFTDGQRVIWEYPHAAPSGEQMDFIEVMEINNGLIQKHRVYWGWFGFNVLKKNQYHQ